MVSAAESRRAATPRRRAVPGFLRRFVAEHPTAVAAAGAVLLSSAITGSLWGQDVSIWGAGPISTLEDGRWWTPLTALLVPDSPIDTVFSMVLALTVFAYAERLLGHWRVLWLGAIVGVGGLLFAVGLHAASWTVTDLRPFNAAEVPVTDPSILLVGTMMAASALASALWRRRLRLFGFAVLVMLTLYAGDTNDWYRLAAAVFGLVAGAVMAHGRLTRPWHRSSVKETRSLVSVLVAVAGLGPLAALMTNGGRGLFSVVADTFAEYDRHLVARCTTDHRSYCDNQVVQVVTHGAGPALLALVPLALLLIAAIGLRQGRRSAWILGVTVLGALAVLAVLQVLAGRSDIESWADGSGLEGLLWSVASIGIPAVLVIVLVLTRRSFPLRATRRAGGIFGIVAAAAFLAGTTVFLTVGSLRRGSFNVDPSPLDLLLGALRRFIPPAFLGGSAPLPYPRHGVALIAYQWTGVGFWAVIVIGMLVLYRSTAKLPEEDSARYRELLRRDGGTLGYLGTWPGNRYWYAPDGQSAVAYRLVNGVALAVTDPLAAPDQRAGVIRGFIEHCAVRDWTPAFYSIHDELLPVFGELGWRHFSVGEETVMVLPGLALDGKAWQKVRHPFTRAEREGVTALWRQWSQLTPSQVAQVLEINEQWVADRALPELGFTLGTIEEMKDPEVALLLAIDAEGRIQAVTSWLPCWRDGRRIGWTLDFMRRRTDAPNGIMEFLIATAALQMRDQGLELLSLSGAPLATSSEAIPKQATSLSELLDWLAAVLEPAYGFASLFQFKRKFHPLYRPMHLAYGDPVELPRIGLAVVRAYLGPRQGAFGLLRRAFGGSR